MSTEGACPREQVWKDDRGAKRVLLCPQCACIVQRVDRYCPHCGQKLAQTASRGDNMLGEKIVLGVGKDAPVAVNSTGGKQSHSPYAFQLLPARAMFAAARTAKAGAEKYGETFEKRNYVKIPPEEHVGHCLQHLYAYLASDSSDEHLAHAIVRAMFAYETAAAGNTKEVTDEEDML